MLLFAVREAVQESLGFSPFELVFGRTVRGPLKVLKFPIDIYTDHNPLVFLNRVKNNNQCLLRWSLILQEYNFNITHIPGRRNVVADALSRGL